MGKKNISDNPTHTERVPTTHANGMLVRTYFGKTFKCIRCCQASNRAAVSERYWLSGTSNILIWKLHVVICASYTATAPTFTNMSISCTQYQRIFS